MPTRLSLAILLPAMLLLSVAQKPLLAQGRETATVNSASAVLDEIMRVPAKGIPRALLAKAEGIIIIPNMLKGGFVLGVRHGHGVALTRNNSGGWDGPRFLQMTGGSIGFQAGVQATDVILVFMTKKSVDGLLHGKFTIGADAAVAAGPVGRQIAAATDVHLKAEILSYSRSRGLFAGVSLDGSKIQINRRAESAYYATPKAGEKASLPKSAVTLLQKVSQYSGRTGDPSVPVETTDQSKVSSTSDRTVVRKQLAAAAIQLSTALPDEWRRYLALPAEVYGTSKQHPSPESLQQTLQRFDKVAADPQYRGVAARTEFKTTHALLRQYRVSLDSKPPEKTPLPPPPKD